MFHLFEGSKCKKLTYYPFIFVRGLLFLLGKGIAGWENDHGMQLGSHVTTCNQDNADAEMQGRPSSLKELKDIPSVWNYLGNIYAVACCKIWRKHEEYVKQLYTVGDLEYIMGKLSSCQSGCLLLQHVPSGLGSSAFAVAWT